MITVIHWIKNLLCIVGFVIASVIGFFACILRWGHDRNNEILGKLYGFFMLLPLGIRVRGVNTERRDLGRSVVYVCNHQHALDMPMMGWLCPRRLVIIGKKELRWYPFFGLLFWAGGNYFIDRQNKAKAYQSLANVLDEVKRKKSSIFVFPEGTRNRTQDPMLPFKKGAFFMALQAGIPVVPIVISPMKDNLARKEVVITFLEPIDTDSFKPGQEEQLADLVRSRMVEHFLKS